MAGVVIALGSYNGYDGPIVFSEEMRDPRQGVPRAVLRAARGCGRPGLIAEPDVVGSRFQCGWP